MTGEHTSWLLILQPGGPGIVTDQELAAHLLQVGSSQTAVGELAARPGQGIPSDRTAADALLLMLESGRRHVPVVDETRRILGVVSDTDLIGHMWRSPLMIRNTIESATDVGGVIDAGRELPRVVCSLMSASVDPVDVGRMVTLVIDALTRRLIDLAVERLGDPPVSWAWLALGSAARREQAILTDQDHALVFDPQQQPLEDLDRYFFELATAVTSGLDDAGIPRCRADVVAENRNLRRPLEHWVAAFETWMDDPRLESARQASILFDLRRAAGPLEAERTLGPVIGSSLEHPRFLRRLAIQALDARPPTGRLHDSVARAKAGAKLDIKHNGLTPIVNLARSYALESGVTEANTLDRLKLAEARGRIDEGTRRGLREAFRLVWRIRMEHHVSCVETGRPLDELVDPTTLGPLTRVQLKEAFRIIRRAQRSLRNEHRLNYVAGTRKIEAP